MADPVRTPRELVEALGGPKRAAHALGMTCITQVYEALRDRPVPARRYLLAKAALPGRDIDPAVFGMILPPAGAPR